MLNKNARFVALVSLFEQFEAHIKFFTNIYQLIMLIARTDAQETRYGDFRADDNNDDDDSNRWTN